MQFFKTSNTDSELINPIYRVQLTFLSGNFAAFEGDNSIDMIEVMLGKNPNLKLSFAIKKKGPLDDFLHVDTATNILVSKAAQLVLKQNGIKGFSILPINLIHRGEDLSEEYGLIQILGRGSSYDMTKVEKFKKRTVADGPKSNYYRNVRLSNTNTTGDIFVPKNSLAFMCNEKFKEVYFENNLKGLEFEELHKMEFMETIFQNMAKKDDIWDKYFS